MPLGAGVDHADTRHTEIIGRYQEPKAIVKQWLSRLELSGQNITMRELESLIVKLDNNQEDLIDFYWQSSTAECPHE